MLTDAKIKRAIAEAVTSGRDMIEIDQTGERGSGRLALRIRHRKGGGTTNEWQVRWKTDGARRFVAIGRYPDMSLLRAREIYQTEHRKVIAANRGGAPVVDPGRPGTVRDLLNEYIGSLEARKAASVEEVRRVCLDAGKPLVALLGADRPASEVTAGEVAAILAPIYRTSPAAAGHARAYLSAAFTYGMRHDNDFRTASRGIRFNLSSNPVAALPSVQSVARTRILTPAELRKFWHKFDASGVDPRSSLILRLTFLTCGRITEAHRIAPAQIEKGKWSKPKTKNGKAHVAPLVGSAQSIAEELARNTKDLPNIQAISKSVRRWCAAEGIEAFQPRDLRRTARTMLEEAGEDPGLLDLQFNHSTVRGGVSKNYNHAQRWAARVELAERWAAIVQGITGSP